MVELCGPLKLLGRKRRSDQHVDGARVEVGEDFGNVERHRRNATDCLEKHGHDVVITPAVGLVALQVVRGSESKTLGHRVRLTYVARTENRETCVRCTLVELATQRIARAVEFGPIAEKARHL